MTLEFNRRLAQRSAQQLAAFQAEFLLQISENDRKFFPAESTDCVRGSNAVQEFFPDLAKDFITGQMTECNVDTLEVVKIDERDTDIRAMVFRRTPEV